MVELDLYRDQARLARLVPVRLWRSPLGFVWVLGGQDLHAKITCASLLPERQGLLCDLVSRAVAGAGSHPGEECNAQGGEGRAVHGGPVSKRGSGVDIIDVC